MYTINVLPDSVFVFGVILLDLSTQLLAVVMVHYMWLIYIISVPPLDIGDWPFSQSVWDTNYKTGSLKLCLYQAPYVEDPNRTLLVIYTFHWDFQVTNPFGY